MADSIFKQMGSVVSAALDAKTDVVTTETKTNSFTAESNYRYLIDTTGGSVTATLPATPTQNDIIEFVDLKGNFENNNLVLGRNGEKIMRLSEDMTVSQSNFAFKLIFSGSIDGWIVI